MVINFSLMKSVEVSFPGSSDKFELKLLCSLTREKIIKIDRFTAFLIMLSIVIFNNKHNGYYPLFDLSGGSRIFQMGGRCFVANGGAHILFSGKKCMKLKEIGLKWGGARLLAPCYSKITIFL